MKCIYHSADLDGHCSAAIVKLRFPEADLIGMDYGRPFPWERIEPREKVIMVDFSLQPFEDMVRLYELCDLVWIDHHVSAIRASEEGGWDKKIEGLRVADIKAGCELTWECLFTDTPPWAVILLGRYDVWDHAFAVDVLPFQFGLRLYDTDPGLFPESLDKLWQRLFNEGIFVDSVIRKGQTILEYMQQTTKKKCRMAAFETEFDGLRCIAMNTVMAGSQQFDSVWDPAKHQAMMTFGLRNDGLWTVSLYSTREDVDVSQACKARGGGGHKGAAGFQAEQISFAIGERLAVNAVIPIPSAPDGRKIKELRLVVGQPEQREPVKG